MTGQPSADGSGPGLRDREDRGRLAADPPVAVLAADVGNSKTDLALVGIDGSLTAALHGPTASHQQLGMARAVAALEALAERARGAAGIDAAVRPLARLAAQSAAGADSPADVRALLRAFERTGLAAEHLIVNDCFGALRAGTSRAWGVAVICGCGVNCAAIAPDGRTARFDALGEISGDWGGGQGIGMAALGAAVRAEDGRGPGTALARTVPEHFGLNRPRAVTLAMYRGRIPERRAGELAPLVFAAAQDGDGVARSIVDRLADEIVAWAGSAIRRARLARLDPDVVLAGGVFRATDTAFYARIADGIARVAPRASVCRLDAPPVLGAALLGLDRLHGGRTPEPVELRLRSALTHEALAQG